MMNVQKKIISVNDFVTLSVFFFFVLLLKAWTACPATFVNVILVALSIATHFTPMNPLYDKYARVATNNPTNTAAIFITFLMAYPATAPSKDCTTIADHTCVPTSESSTVFIITLTCSHAITLSYLPSSRLRLLKIDFHLE